MAPILQVENLSISYGNLQAVRNVSFEIEAGEVLAVVGESGSGKSTLALSLPRLLDGTRMSGSVSLECNGSSRIDLVKASERKLNRIRGRQISTIFQEPMSSLNPIQRIGKQIAEAISLHTRLRHSDVHERSVSLLKLTGIVDPEGCLRSYPHQLSGGQCQRVGIAIALANHPSLLIADEPTTALDVTVQAQIVSCLSALRRTHGTAILFITHDLGLVRRFADRVLVMYAGQIVECGRVEDVFARPRMPYTEALLASRPKFDETGAPVPLEPIPGAPVSFGAFPTGCTFHPRCRYVQLNVCCEEPPHLQSVDAGHAVRCARWRQINDG
jgi:oligopeptide/dipeptide ABC transporter ATP-binding protein